MVDFTERDWDDIVATNLTAPFVVSQAVLPALGCGPARWTAVCK